VEEILALAALNRFGSSSPKADIVPPSEESVFILTSGQLQDIIKEAIQPLQDRIGSLEARIIAQDEKIAALESTQEQDTTRLCVDIAHDRQRLAKLEKIEPQPLQRDRGEILRALLAVNGGKMLAKDARQKMHLEPWTFSKLLDTMTDYIETRPYRLKGNQKLLVLKSNLIARNMQQD
jgi:hypothetical protein